MEAEKRNRSNNAVRLVLAASVVAAIGGGYLYFNAPVKAAAPAAAMPAAMPVSVAAAIERRVTEFDEFSGRLEAIDQVAVRPRVAGYIESIHFTPGAMVKKGDTLFLIDPKPYEAEVARAEAVRAGAQAKFALAGSELARAQRLLADRAVAQREFEERQNEQREAQASIQAAQAALDIARLNLGYTRITAPISGRVSRAEVTVGNLVAAGAGGPALTSIVSTARIYATFEADEQTFLKYAANAVGHAKTRIPVYLGLANEQGHPRSGVIESVDNRLDPQSGTIRVRAVFDNADGVLTPGLFARLKIDGAGAKPAVLINDRAVGTDQSKKFVFVVDPNNKVGYREVQLGPVIDGLRVVRQGLAAGDVIVVNGLQRVRPGATVAPTTVEMTEKSQLVQRRAAPASQPLSGAANQPDRAGDKTTGAGA
jgi:multidrug efflux system membrane fusion protein